MNETQIIALLQQSTPALGTQPIVQLWTYHSSKVKLDSPDFYIDSTQGGFWNSKQKGFRYREVLPILCKGLGLTHYPIWGFLVPGCMERHSANIDLVEWEINAPVSQIRAFLKVSEWDHIVNGRSDDWSQLIITNNDEITGKHANALVVTPLPPQFATCHGQLPVKYPR